MTEPPKMGARAGDVSLLAVLERIEGRLDSLEKKFERIEHITQQGAQSASAVVNAVDDTVEQLSQRGVDVNERVQHALVLVEKLTRPDTMKALEGMLSLATQAPAMVAAATDSIDGWIASIQQQGIDLDARARTTLAVAERLTSPSALEAVSTFLDHVEDIHFLLSSGVFDRSTVRVIGELGKALAASSAEVPQGVGMWGLMKAGSDEDIQRAIGFTVGLAKRMGAALGSPTHQIHPRTPALATGDAE